MMLIELPTSHRSYKPCFVNPEHVVLIGKTYFRGGGPDVIGVQPFVELVLVNAPEPLGIAGTAEEVAAKLNGQHESQK